MPSPRNLKPKQPPSPKKINTKKRNPHNPNHNHTCIKAHTAAVLHPAPPTPSKQSTHNAVSPLPFPPCHTPHTSPTPPPAPP